MTENEKFKSKFLLDRKEVKTKFDISDSDADTYVRLYYRKAFGIRAWCSPPLSDLSFPTAWLSINHEEVNALLQCYKMAEIPKEVISVIDALKVKLEIIIMEKKWNELGFFVKLDTRSPKDAHMFDISNKRLHGFITREFDKLTVEDRQDKSKEVLTFIKAANKSLRLTCASDAIELLTHSMRVRDDFNSEYNLGQKLCDVHLILRQWMPELVENPHLEFRGFVHNRKLNALTQYFGVDAFPDLIERKDEIERLILKFYEENVRPFLEHESCIIDFYITKENKVMLIELNPFYASAGAGLFNWKEDRNLFMNGPFEFRVITEKTVNPDKHIPPVWRRELNRIYHKEEEEDKEEGSRRICLIS